MEQVIFLRVAVTHILRVNCAEMAGDRPRQHAYEIFSIKCKFQHFKFSPPKFKETSTTSTVGSTHSD